MKLGQLHRYGEIHALRGGWWLLALLFKCGRPVCHTKGHKLVGRWARDPELATCNWCRRKLGLPLLAKGTPQPEDNTNYDGPYPDQDDPLPATFEEAVHEGLLAGTLPKPSNGFPGYTPSILFDEPELKGE